MKSPVRTPASTTPLVGPRDHTAMLWLGVMVLLWGLSWPATRILLDVIPPLWLAALRFGSAALCLFAFGAWRGVCRLPARADWPIVASMGLLQMMAFTGLGMIAMTRVDTSRAVLMAYTTPLWGMLVTWLVFRAAPTRLQLLALFAGLGGIALICSPLELDWHAPGMLTGAGFLLVGAICWSIVIVHIRHHRWTSSPLALAPWQMLLATLPLTVFAWALEGAPSATRMDAHVLELLVFIGPIATSACFVISAEYGRRISTFAMANYTLGVPLIGILSSVLILGNRLSPVFAGGLGLILLGIVLTSRASRSAARS